MKKIIGSILSLLILMNVFVPVNAEQSSTSASAPVNVKQSPTNASAPSKWQIEENVCTNNLNRVSCFKNNLYITIGASGTIRTSPDGLNWTTNLNVSNATSSELKDIVCTDNQIVVVGENGTILRSTDGADWTTIKPITSNLIYKVIYGNNTLLAFTDKAGEILTSKDGINWKLVKTSSKQFICDATWNGKVFVAVGYNGEISTSKDGFVWRTKILKNKPNFGNILWNGKIFIAFGTTDASTDNYDYTSGQYIASSKDGYNWSIKTLKTKSLKKNSPEIYICYCQNIFWDGKTFRLILQEQTGQPPAPESRLITYTSDNTLNWKRNETNISGDCLIAWSGKDFIAVGSYSFHFEYYGNTIYHSKDAIKWDQIIREEKEGCNAHDIICNNGKIILVGNNGEISSSTDGLNWTKADSIHYPQVWDGKRFLSLDKKTYYLYSSIDGITWKKENQIDWNLTYGNIYWTGEEYITFGPNYYISTSKDLITWYKTKYEDTNCVYKDITSISAFASDGTKYVLAGQYGTAVSKDMKNWVSRKERNNYTSIIIGSSSFVALNSGNQIDVSYDGLKWKRLKIKDYNSTIKKIIYANDKFIGVGTNGDVWYSKDGATWAKTDSTVNKTLNDICWTGNEFITAGNEGTIITSKDGVEWHQEESPVKSDLLNVFANNEIAIIKCTDGYIYKSLK